MPFDITYAESQNILSSNGFVSAMINCLRVRPGGKLSAPVCSSWVYLSRGSTGRSAGYPLGSVAETCADANYMVCRVVLLLFLCIAKQLWFIVEQPQGSLLQYHPSFQDVCKHVRIWRKYVTMAKYGAGSQKGTWLYSGCLLKQAVTSLFEFVDYVLQLDARGKWLLIRGYGAL